MDFSVLWFFGFVVSWCTVETKGQMSLSSLPCLSATVASERGSRIVGGTNAARGQMPFIVSLRRRGGHFCGASILNERWLLTAAHCVCNGVNKIMKPNQIDALFGQQILSEFDDKHTVYGDRKSTAFKVGFKSIILYANYDCRKTDNDIALLELKEPVKFNEAVQPTCIATGSFSNNNTFANESASVSGWGWTNENQEIGIRADHLQVATVQVWSNQNCQNSYRMLNKPHIIADTQMCAGSNGVDSCWADSGGPLVSSDNVLVGLVSTGIGCSRPGLPGIYTRVSEYSKWIESIAMASR